MREDLLAGATRVLERQGAAGFTTNRVAEASGVSVGSVYQYYPNKGALLADLHTAEAERLWVELEATLTDGSRHAHERFEGVVLKTFEAQAAAAEHHAALRTAGVAPRELPPMTELEQRVTSALTQFIRAEVPCPAPEAAAHAAFCVEVLFALLDRMATQPPRDFRRTAENAARMLAAHVGLGC
jgi:AcrR family transcriptional regulator